LYRQLAQFVIDAIEDGRLQPGDGLPGEQNIADSNSESTCLLSIVLMSSVTTAVVGRPPGSADHWTLPPEKRQRSCAHQ